MYKCRSCQSSNTHSIIPLGEQPVANALIAQPGMQQDPQHNLEVMLCLDCGLAQLHDLLPPEQLFSEYLYFSSTSDTMLHSVRTLVEREIAALDDTSLVIEIASNDGYLLKNYIEHNIPVLGIDPAENISRIANNNGIPTLCEFFGENLARTLQSEGRQADIIHANNVMAHIPDINGFAAGLKILLKEKGRAIIEVPYFLELFEKLEFDTIYHEHVYYFSVKPLKTLFERHGLELFDIERLPIHGGSLRLYVGHKGTYAVQSIVADLIEKETEEKLYDPASFQSFMAKIEALKTDIHRLLKDLKATGARIAAYGASAKGTTLLNYFRIGKDQLSFVVDRSPAKQGLYTPGTRLEIKPPSALIEENANYALLLAWNFSDEIMSQQQSFINNNGKFILPLPEAKIIP